VIPATPAEQRRLLDLQEVDTLIRQLEHRRLNLPEQKALDENAETLSAITRDYAANREKLEQLERQQKRYEDEIAALESRRKSEEGRMYSGTIHNERELQAIRGEISSLRTRKSDTEDELLEVMEQREEAEQAVTTLKERHAELTAAVGELTEARDTAATDIDAELAQRHAERDEVAGDISSEVREYYDQLRERKNGVAVAALSGKTCHGCRLELTAIELEDVEEQTKTGLARCEQCGRILVPR
jgi:uncharacterized protein